jgi:AcrR family transcriptional regulator
MATARLSSQARRAAILDAAVRLFSEKGFRGVTTRELAAAVGVSEPVLYQHFETKRDLYHAIIEERAVQGDRAIPVSLCETLETVTDDRAFLIRLANGIINWHVSDPTYARLLLFSALERHELSQMFIDRYSGAFVGGIADYFERRVADGAFRPMDPLITAHTFIGMAGHFGMNRAIFGHSPVNLPQDRIVEGFIDIFLEGIKKRS